MSKQSYQNRLLRMEARIRAHKRKQRIEAWIREGRAKYLVEHPDKAHLFGEQS